jgi:hypothetical protein
LTSILYLEYEKLKEGRK